MAEKKRKNKPGAGRPATGRTYRVNSFRVEQTIGEQMTVAAKEEGWASLIERLWTARRP